MLQLESKSDSMVEVDVVATSHWTLAAVIALVCVSVSIGAYWLGRELAPTYWL